MDLESKSDLIRGYHDDPKSPFGINGDRVGWMEVTDDRASGTEVDPCPYPKRASVSSDRRAPGGPISHLNLAVHLSANATQQVVHRSTSALVAYS